MRIIKKVSDLIKHLHVESMKGHSIGFTPTMGALHEGHLSLLNASIADNDISVVSIFVNPKQFNQKEDLVKYPRNLDKDSEMLKEAGCQYVFAPPVREIYPKDYTDSPELDISQFIQSMEGPNRPGHFEGVVQVMYRLLKIVSPDRLYMGQKDFQQFTIIDYMINQFDMDTKLVVCPTVREDDGLAMSSRNLRLEANIKSEAHIIHDMLVYAKEQVGQQAIENLENEIMKRLTKGPFRAEYFDIVDGNTMEKVSDPKKHNYIVACTAVWAGDVRLIDNMILKAPEVNA